MVSDTRRRKWRRTFVTPHFTGLSQHKCEVNKKMTLDVGCWQCRPVQSIFDKFNLLWPLSVLFASYWADNSRPSTHLLPYFLSTAALIPSSASKQITALMGLGWHLCDSVKPIFNRFFFSAYEKNKIKELCRSFELKLVLHTACNSTIDPHTTHRTNKVIIATFFKMDWALIFIHGNL